MQTLFSQIVVTKYIILIITIKEIILFIIGSISEILIITIKEIILFIIGSISESPQ